MEAVQMNTRLPRDLKHNGDAIFERYEITPSQAVRALWKYTVINGTPPEFVCLDGKNPEASKVKEKLRLIRNGIGLAISTAQKECGYTGEAGNLLEGKTWHELRSDMYDEMLDDLEQSCI